MTDMQIIYLLPIFEGIGSQMLRVSYEVNMQFCTYLFI